MKFLVGDRVVREFEIELADGRPSFWAFADVSAFRGKKLTVAVDALPPESKGLEAISQGDDLKGATTTARCNGLEADRRAGACEEALGLLLRQRGPGGGGHLIQVPQAGGV